MLDKELLEILACPKCKSEKKVTDEAGNEKTEQIELEYDEKTHLKNQSLKIMCIIHDAYDKLSFSIRKE